MSNEHGWRIPYGRCGRCHTNYASATPTLCYLVIAGHTNNAADQAVAIPTSGHDHPCMNTYSKMTCHSTYIPHGRIVMYADDTQFFDAESPSNLQALKTRIESSLAASLKWFTQNRLKINPTKTEMIILKSRRQNSNSDLSIHFGNDEISPKQSVKVLGVVIDEHLSWNYHISLVVQRCYCVLVSLARITHKLPKCVRQMLIESLVFPHIRYCITVWGNCTATQKQRVQKAINFGVRIVTGLGRREHVTPSLRELDWPSVDDVIAERYIAIIHHLITVPDAPELLRRRLVRRSDVSSRRTRATESGQLELPRPRTEFARRSFFYRAASAWNASVLNVPP